MQGRLLQQVGAVGVEAVAEEPPHHPGGGEDEAGEMQGCGGELGNFINKLINYAFILFFLITKIREVDGS